MVKVVLLVADIASPFESVKKVVTKSVDNDEEPGDDLFSVRRLMRNEYVFDKNSIVIPAKPEANECAIDSPICDIPVPEVTSPSFEVLVVQFPGRLPLSGFGVNVSGKALCSGCGAFRLEITPEE